MPTKELLTEEFSTQLSLDKAQFDSENMVIKGASLTFFRSRNGSGREYLPEAMADLREKSEGAFLYNDAHISKAGAKHRQLSEVGVIRNVTGDSKRNRGDIHLFETDAAKTFFQVCKADPSAYALSHEAMQCRTSGHAPLKVHSVESVPGFILTASPGTNTSLFESLEDGDMSLTVKSLREDYPEIVEELLAEEMATLDPPKSDSEVAQQLIEAKLENEKLKTELANLKKEKAEREAAEKYAETLGALRESMEAIAEKDGRVLSESMFDLFVLAHKGGLEDLTEDDKTGFIKQLPLLSEGPEPTEPPAPGARSGSSTKGSANRSKASSLLKSFLR